jgi:predicted CXXCH cytochrome family protein
MFVTEREIPMRCKKAAKALGIVLLLLLMGAYYGAHYAVALLDRSAPPEPEMQAGTGAVYGYVTAARNRLLPGVPMLGGVKITLSPGNFSCISDNEGVYQLTDVPPGTYALTFSKEGYEDYSLAKTRIMTGQALYLDGSLFPQPMGPAEANLRLSTAMGIGRVPQEFPYNSTVYLDAGKSKNASREGFRWEVLDESGNLLYDPFSAANPLAPQVSEMPKASPYMFTFVPPASGTYTVRLYLRNNQHAGESLAEINIKAVNIAPVAIPRLFPGPQPPTQGGSAGKPATGGFSVTYVGAPVYLRGYALDKNYPMPEQFNPGGTEPTLYGQNNDHELRAFNWRWRLERDTDGRREDVSSLLQSVVAETGNGAQHVFFIPEEQGTYHAYLTVSDNDPWGALSSVEQAVAISVLQGREAAYAADENLCLECHDSGGKYPAAETPWADTVHGNSETVNCQSCHGPAQLHIEAKGQKDKKSTITVTHDAGLCGQCHQQYNEWEKSFHSDGYSFGFEEIARPLLLNCTKCHYPEGFSRTAKVMEQEGRGFKEVSTMKPMFPGGPMFFDFSLLPDPDGKSIACSACHNPHGSATRSNPFALRMGGADALCATCHEEKWHNVLLRGTAGQTGSAYEYPGSDYNLSNPHLFQGGCVYCHMDTTSTALDDKGIRQVGGHTLRMRAVGEGGSLGGYGPTKDNPDQARTGEEAANILNLTPCLNCHQTDSFNINRQQQENFTLWLHLGATLKEHNNGLLPGFKPGDKCATCHRGGTLPFDTDPELRLENAYTNYKLIGNDRSWGIHNPAYTRTLLQDALQSLQ